MTSFFARIEASGIATTISQSVPLNGALSGLHLVGLTLLVGSVLVSSLRLLGAVLPHESVAEVTRAARRIFQWKMLLLCAAAAFHFAIYRNAARGTDRTELPPWVAGAFGLMLWSAVVLAGAAFILIE